MADDDVILLNDFSGLQERARSSGKTQTTVSVSYKSEVIAVNLDEKALGEPIVAAMTKAVRDGIAGINEEASAATKRTREKNAAAFDRGEAWARKEFGGGRMGAMRPNRSGKLFNDSGRLAAGIVYMWQKAEQVFTIRFPANRFSPEALAARPELRQVFDRLVQLVPAIRNPLAAPGVAEVHRQVWAESHRKRAMAAAEKRREMVGKIALEGLRGLRALIGA